MPLTCFVTGSQGFLGKAFRQFQRFAFDKIIWGTTRAVPVENGEWRQFAPEYADIEQVLQSEKIDVIIHLAAAIPCSFAEAGFETHFLANVRMMEALTRFAVNQGVKKIIYISTFGSMSDPAQYDIQDYYTLGKITGEHMCKMLEPRGIETASLRIPSPYGEFNQSRTVLNLFLENALSGRPLQVYGTGSRCQNFLYVGDIVRAVECCLERAVSGVYPMQGDTVTMRTLAETILEVTQSKSQLLIGHKPDPLENQGRINVDTSRARVELGFESRISLSEGLKNTVNWLKGRPLEDRADLGSACQS